MFKVILDFIVLHLHWIIVLLTGPVVLKLAKKLDEDGINFVMEELEALRAGLKKNEITNKLEASDAVVNILESYIPEVLHEMSDTIKSEVKNGNVSVLDWTDLGKRLWAKGKTEVCDGAVNYWKTSEHKDEEAIAAMIAKKFFHKQAALQQGIIVPHK